MTFKDDAAKENFRKFYRLNAAEHFMEISVSVSLAEDMEQLQDLHQIDHVEIPDGEIDQEPRCRRKSFYLPIKNESRKSYRKSDISDKQLY